MKTHTKRGFTIVELLIVIVVIGILATVTVVAYNGVQRNTQHAAIQADLRSFGIIMERQKIENGSYPATLTADMGIKFNRSVYGLDFQNTNIRYCRNATTDQYILYVNSKSGSYFKQTNIGKAEPATATYGWDICAQVGLTTTNPTQNGLSGTTWSAWVN